MNRRILTLLFAVSVVLVLVLSASDAAAQSSSALWFVSYWNNTELEGDPVHKSNEGLLNHDWGNASPAPGVHADHWSARWTTFVELESGSYRFTATNDDGVRLYVGNKHIIVDWNEHPAVNNEVTVSLNGGRYPVAVDFFDDLGRARLNVAWQRTGPAVPGAADVTIVSSGPTSPPAAPGQWQASYWNNTSLQGTPVLLLKENKVDYYFGGGSPSSAIQVDNWSARWTNNLNLIPGRYHFTVTSDDGARLWLNNQLAIDRWFDHPVQTFTTEVDWPGGSMPVRLEYYERTHLAQIHLSWTRLGPALDTGGQPMATVTAAWLNVRTGPSVDYSVITTIPGDTAVTLMARNNSATWVQVMLPDGRQGWVNASYLSTDYPIGALPLA